MSPEVKVRWAVRLFGSDEWWHTWDDGTERGRGGWREKKLRRLMDRDHALTVQANEERNLRRSTRLVKVTIKKKQRKSLGRIACEAYNGDDSWNPTWADVAHWERAAQAVKAEVLRRGATPTMESGER